MRRRACIDENQPDIVDRLRAVGASVQLLHLVGGGVPDLLVGYQTRNWLLEVKNPLKPRRDQRLTVDQVAWHQSWRGQVAIVRTIDEALAVLGLRRAG